ncbi:MAG TPA: glycosyltransferase family 9 protein [bacterium]
MKTQQTRAREHRLARWWQRIRGWLAKPAVRRATDAGWAVLYAFLGAGTIVAVKLASLGRRNARTAPVEQVRRIILLRPDGLRGILHALPACEALRRAYPAAFLTAVVSADTEALMRELPVVDNVIALRGSGLIDRWMSMGTVRRLRLLRADAALAFEPSWTCGLMAYLTGAGERVGWTTRGAGAFFTKQHPYRAAKVKTHSIDVHLQLVRLMGVSAERSLPAPRVPPRARAWVAQWWQQQRWPAEGVRVLLHPGSGSPATRWAPERFAEVADRIAALPDAHVFILAGPGEQDLATRVRSRMSAASSVVHGLDLAQLMAVMERMHLFIGNATGTTQLAAYLGPSVIQVIGGTHPLDCPEHWGVIGHEHRIVHRRPEEVIGRSTNAWHGPEGLAHIRAEDVWRAVQEVWPRCAERAGGAV